MFANVLSEIQACRKFLLARRRGLTIWVIVFTYSRSGYIKIHKFNFTKYFNSGNNIIIFFFRNDSESKTITSLTTFSDLA